jgi:hypothetical protein
MTKKQTRYIVNRGIQRDGDYRHEAGDEVDAQDIPGAPIKIWLDSGVLERLKEVGKDGDG